MAPALVILAAGMGSRYGGDKHAAAVGPGGATISDYLIHDALRAGFGEIVLVIRDGMQAQLDETITRRFGRRVPIRYAVQRLDDVPSLGRRGNALASRTKPWGTSQAVLTAARTITTPFGVVNADDLYGPASFAALARFLRETPPDTHALVGFPVKDTLSPHGTVNRAVCRVNAAGLLDGIREVTGIEPHPDGAAYRDEGGALRVLPGDTPVSMNMWGFTPAIAPALEQRFAAFLERRGGDPSAEFVLPATVEELVRDGKTPVRVLTGAFKWWGITYPADRAVVADAIAQLIASGVYPVRLDA